MDPAQEALQVHRGASVSLPDQPDRVRLLQQDQEEVQEYLRLPSVPRSAGAGHAEAGTGWVDRVEVARHSLPDYLGLQAKQRHEGDRMPSALLAHWLWLDQVLLKLPELRLPEEVRIRKLGAAGTCLLS